MKTLLRVALGGLLVGASLSASAAPVEMMVKYKSYASPKLINAAIGARTLNDLYQIGWQRVQLPATLSKDRALRYFRSLSSVEKVEAPVTRRGFLTPNDAQYPQQYAPQKISMPGAWEYSIGSPEVVVAVVDTGVRRTHQDLAANLINGGYDFGNGDADNNDGYGHGTAVSGCVSAVTNNGIGIAGTAWNVKVFNIKVFPDGQLSGSVAPILQGIMAAADQGCRIINLSLGAEGSSDSEREAIDYALDRGCLIVASAGNNPVSTPNYPAAFPEVISVGATDENDKQSDFTNFGPTVDVAAPGVQVLTTNWTGDSVYSKYDGTSFSAPITSGVLALMLSYSPGSTNAELREALESTTVPVGDWLVHGRIDAAAAMARLIPPAVTDNAPTAAATSEGQAVNSTGFPATDASFVTEADNSSLEVASVYQPTRGSVASITATIPVDYNPATYVSSRLQLDLKAASRVTALVMIYNPSTNAYELFRSYGLTTGMRSINVNLPQAMLTKYLVNGELRLFIRTILPSRLGGSTGSNYRASFDSVRVVTTARLPR